MAEEMNLSFLEMQPTSACSAETLRVEVCGLQLLARDGLFFVPELDVPCLETQVDSTSLQANLSPLNNFPGVP